MTTTGSPRPGGDTVAALTIDVDAHSPVLARSRRYAAHTGTMSHQQYGVDVGVPRLLRLLDEEAVPATFFVPGWVAEHHPGLTAAILEQGHEVAHHTYAHRPPVEMTDDEQRADFTRALEVFAAQDVPVEGFRAANWQSNETTCRLVAEHGLYDSSLMGHDRPYRVTTTDGGRFVELPPHWSLDDWEQYAFLPDPHVGSVIQAPHTVLAMWRDELDAHARHQALFMLTLHPELTGRPARAEALRSLLAYARGRGIRFAHCADIARAAAADPHLTTHSTAPPTADAYPA
ncbi:polysaccharide deacetylase [Streptomyces sp. CNQ-509]|uniref:polysaccharide deacetylase family protein n=1 Tax=unclassified Streptomyces TaxID=2593676 RepID=UPI00062DED01|nr:polysaccharide deacetylase family protein [Streptomyces sp. CNQ-509]AKH80986.1 polysaccharide deacetylase [Streptomyces sp. CNQ-509]